MKDELVDIVDESDSVIGTVIRKEMREKNLLHRCTYILVFSSNNEVLVTKRTNTKDVAPGLYEIGQGGVVAHGESYEENAERELLEEVGIKSKLSYLFDFNFNSNKGRFIAKVFTCKYDGKIKLQKEEIESGFFISMEKLRGMLKKNQKSFTSDSIVMIKKYFEYLSKLPKS